MKSCKTCFWCRWSWHPKYYYKCKLGYKVIGYPRNYIGNPKWHGWFCKHYEKMKDEEE